MRPGCCPLVRVYACARSLENQGLVDDDMAALAVAIKQVQPTFYIKYVPCRNTFDRFSFQCMLATPHIWQPKQTKWLNG